MRLDSIFERLVVREAEIRCPTRSTGRPRTLCDARNVELMFRVLRSGMQWRELQCEVNYTTVMRRTGGVCDVLKSVRDRDELACVNMLLATSSVLRHTQWPHHLTRDG